MKKTKLLFLFLLACIGTKAQTEYYFTKGLSINGVHKYGREALYADQLAYQLYSNTLKQPAEGAASGLINAKGEEQKWQLITADTANRFINRNFRFGSGGGGYIYFTYESAKEQTALLNISGNSAVYFNGELHTGDPYNSGWLYIPVKLKKGTNEIFVRSGFILVAKLIFPDKPVQLNTADPTIPFIVPNEKNDAIKGAIVVINASAQPLKNYQIKSSLNGKEKTVSVPVIPPMSTRKVIFEFNAEGISGKGEHNCTLSLFSNKKLVDEKTISVSSVNTGEQYSNTFISDIDGSLQYYAVTPQTPADEKPAALFLSVHGAGVEAIGQARAYKPKDWGNLVAATNRRPRGFNWEDWGRLDALEVLNIAKEKFKPDPSRIYLTGHSMGGHGTWFLGATYPDQWAAIAPCAGYPTLKGYGSADGLIPGTGATPMEQLLLRSSNQSDVPKLAMNYQSLGVYILHGDSDKVVSVNYARQMKKQLADFHKDFSYYEYPGGEHWFGDQSVDWKPIFDYFKLHSIAPDSAMNNIDFTTASPGISAKYRWIAIEQQQQPLQYSRIQLNRDKQHKTIIGKTQNIELVKIKLDDFGSNASIHITLDSLNTIAYSTTSGHDSIYLRKKNNEWLIVNQPTADQKNPLRYGTFKDPFNHRMIFVYGTKGTAAENTWSFNKAKYDAETWYYRGNGAVDIIADKDYSAGLYAGRNVIIYGNANTNSVYNLLLQDCPIKVERNTITAGNETITGDDLAAYFIWPIKNTSTNSVAVIAGTGIKGMQAAIANQYFAGASGFPDFMVFKLGMLQKGAEEIKLAGFYDNEWKLSNQLYILNK